jgi:hypothetical protein
MAINPLVVFVGLSVATVGGLVAVSYSGPEKNQTAPVVEKKQIPLPTPNVEPTKKLAALPPAKVPKITPPPKKTPDTKTPVKTPVAKTPPQPKKPSFDVVRVEEDGGTVVVGKAEPNADVVLKLNGKIFGKARANSTGDWVFVPDQLVPKGSHELTIQATGPDNKTLNSEQTIIIAMPEGKNAKPLVVVAKPDGPTKVLQQPEAEKVASVEKKQPAPTNSKEAQPAQPEKSAEKKAANTTKIAKTPVQKAPEPKAPAKSSGGETVIAAVPVEKKPMAEAPAVKLPPKAPAVVGPAPTVKKATPGKTVTPRTGRLAFGSVDYNDSGDIVFSGKATAGGTVRIYVDNRFVGDSTASATGEWVFNGRANIKPGVHELRADLVTGNGTVLRRRAVPFVRAHPRKVAALLQTRSGKAQSAAQKSEPVKTVTKAPAPKPVVTAKSPETLTPAKKVATIAPTSPVSDNKLTKKVEKPVADTATAPVRKKAEPVHKSIAAVPKKSDTTAQSKEVASPPVKTKAPEKTVSVAEKVAPVEQPVIETAKKPAAEKDKLVSHVVIQPGNNLWNISRVIYGKGVAYTTIYQANKEQIKNPNRIYPGQIFDTPGAMTSGRVNPDLREPVANIDKN